MHWTINNTQKDPKFTETTIDFPESLDQLTEKYGKEGAYNLIVRAFPVAFRQTDGTQESADAILRGETAGGGGRSPYLALYDSFINELSQDKADKVRSAIEFTGFSKANFKSILANSKVTSKKLREKYLSKIKEIEAENKRETE